MASSTDVVRTWLLQEQQQHKGIARTYDIMGRVYEIGNEQGKYEMALEQYGKCLAINIKALGEDHPDVATTYGNIASVYYKQGKHEMALEQYARCLAVEIKALGEDHPSVAMTYNNTAVICWWGQGKHEMALEQYAKCLAIQIKTLGEDHPVVAATYTDNAMCKRNMADLLERQGELARAGGLFRESAAICRKVHGPQHAETLYNLARARMCELLQTRALLAL